MLITSTVLPTLFLFNFAFAQDDASGSSSSTESGGATANFNVDGDALKLTCDANQVLRLISEGKVLNLKCGNARICKKEISCSYVDDAACFGHGSVVGGVTYKFMTGEVSTRCCNIAEMPEDFYAWACRTRFLDTGDVQSADQLDTDLVAAEDSQFIKAVSAVGTKITSVICLPVCKSTTTTETTTPITPTPPQNPPPNGAEGASGAAGAAGAGGNPSNNPGSNPGTNPVSNPGTNPGTSPGSSSSETAKPGNQPGSSSSETAKPGQQPGTASHQHDSSSSEKPKQGGNDQAKSSSSHEQNGGNNKDPTKPGSPEKHQSQENTNGEDVGGHHLRPVDGKGGPSDGAGGGGAAACFSGDSKVSTKHRVILRMDELQLGDEVLSVSNVGDQGSHSAFTYSPVTMFTHRLANVTNAFIEILTEDDGILKLTPDHLLPLVACNGETFLKSKLVASFVAANSVRASKAAVGQCILKRAQGELRLVKIRNVSRVVANLGIFAPITATGNIVVNDVLASCYAGYEDHAVQHSVFSILRVIETFVQTVAEYLGFNSESSEIEGEIPVAVRVLLEAGHSLY